MAQTEQVPFSIARVRAGEIGLPQLSAGYLAVLAAATGRPLITTAPTSRVDRDWSDYDRPSEEETHEWGSEACGLRAIVSGQFVHHGRRGGAMLYWVFLGLPAGLQVSGEASLHDRWHSYAKLAVEGDEAAGQRLGKAFRAALAPCDLRREPDGVAVAALEEALTDLCWLGSSLDGKLAPPLVAAARAVPAERPAGAATRYLLACIAQATGDLDGAARLLGELAGSGDGLRFSHGIHCARADDGAPGRISWQDDFPPPAPAAEVQLSLGWLQERGGQRKEAVASYKAAARAGGLPGDAAKRQLRRLKVK